MHVAHIFNLKIKLNPIGRNLNLYGTTYACHELFILKKQIYNHKINITLFMTEFLWVKNK